MSRSRVLAKERRRKAKNEARKQRRSKPEAESLPPIRDRRAMEGIMRQLLPGASDPGTAPEAAQEIMYQAFEADNPRPRAIGAHVFMRVRVSGDRSPG